MPLAYRLYQDNRKTSLYPGKWYARAVHYETIDVKKVASEVEKVCTVTRADILAVIDSLVACMKTELQNSKSVKLDGMGIFNIGISSKFADSAEKFNAGTMIKGYHVNFLPETTGGGPKGVKRSRALIDGVTLEETPVQDKVTNAGKKA